MDACIRFCDVLSRQILGNCRMEGEEIQKRVVVFERLRAVLYPPRCAVCGEIRPAVGELCCPLCREGFTRIKEPCCMRCGKQLKEDTQEYCHDCMHKRFHYEKGFPLWRYDSRLRRSVAEFKYKGRREYAAYYIQELCKEFGFKIQRLAPDCLIPVPVHQSRLKSRGYNQAALLAEGLAKELGLFCDSGYLCRIRKTLPQKELDDRERLKNLTSAFAVNPKRSRDRVPECVVLVDDIYTTGSTVEACTRVLKAHGTARVYYVSLGIGTGYNEREWG